MSKKGRVKNTTKPELTVKIGDEDKKLSDVVYIDLTHYPRWTNTVQIGDFNNCLKDSNEALRHFFFIIDRLIPDIEEYGPNIFNGRARHCHLLRGSEDKLARKVIRAIHGDRILDGLSEIWELSAKTEEIRVIGTFVNDKMHIFYPLFIDHHHLIYPDKNYNSPDYKKYNFTKKRIKSA